MKTEDLLFLNTCGQVLISFVFAITLTLFGKLLLRWFRASSPSFEDASVLETSILRTSSEFALGFGVWGLLGQLLAQFGAFHFSVPWAFCLVMLVWGFYSETFSIK